MARSVACAGDVRVRRSEPLLRLLLLCACAQQEVTVHGHLLYRTSHHEESGFAQCLLDSLATYGDSFSVAC